MQKIFALPCQEGPAQIDPGDDVRRRLSSQLQVSEILKAMNVFEYL
jgi:hypothetical protein